jgi:hypothetical protein
MRKENAMENLDVGSLCSVSETRCVEAAWRRPGNGAYFSISSTFSAPSISVSFTSITSFMVV